MRRSRRQILAHIVLSVMIFAGGLAAGWFGQICYNQRQQDYNRKHPEQAARLFAERIGKRIKLDGAAQAKLNEVMEEHWARMQSIRKQMYPRLQNELDLVRSDIAPALTIEQLAAWDDNMFDMARRWQYAPQSHGQPVSLPATQPASEPAAAASSPKP
jgi:hypothetical protein